MVANAGLRVLHMADLHSVDPQNDGYLDALERHLSSRQSDEATKYHAVTTPGDLLELTPRGNGTATRALSKINKHVQSAIQTEEHKEKLAGFQQSLEEIIKTNDIKEGTSPEDVDPEVLKQIQGVHQESQSYLAKVQESVMEEMIDSKQFTLDDILPIIEADYRALGKRFQRIRDLGVEVLASPGNHDTQLAYLLDTENGGPLTFIDKRKSFQLTGYNGTTFTVQGDPNTFERPVHITNLIGSLLAHKDEQRTENDIYIDYNSGLCLDPNNKGTYDHAIPNHISSENTEGVKLVKSYQEAARKRMGKPGEADIYLTHKVTNYAGMGTGDVAKEYSQSATTVLAGHEHQLQIGKIQGLKALINEMKISDETEQVDGQEVKVMYFDGNEPLQLNAGKDFAFEVVYDSNKRVEEVVVYQLQDVEVKKAA